MTARLLTTVALLAILAWQSWHLHRAYMGLPLAQSVAKAVVPTQPVPVPPDPFQARLDVRTDQLLARPPFWPSRRPIMPPDPEPEPVVQLADVPTVVAVDPPPFRVTGIVITDDVRLAFLVPLQPATAGEQAVRVGETFEGWVLEEVASDGVTVGQQGRHEKLMHRVFSNDKPETKNRRQGG